MPSRFSLLDSDWAELSVWARLHKSFGIMTHHLHREEQIA